MYKPRDYRKPVQIKFKGRKGLEAYLKIVNTPPVKYDAEKKAQEALDDLRKQGVKI